MAIPDEEAPAPLPMDAGQAALFHALAEPPRLALLKHLSTGEHRVRDLVEHLHLAQSTVSKHLSCLHENHLVQVRTAGRASWYSLADADHLADLLAAADALLTSGEH